MKGGQEEERGRGRGEDEDGGDGVRTICDGVVVVMRRGCGV